MTSSSPSGDKSPVTLLSIPLKYTYLAKPATNEDKNQHVYYETSTTSTNNSIWRPVDTKDTSDEFKQTLDASLFTDNLPSLRTVTSAISAEGQVQARLVEDRILENTLTINLAGPGNVVSAERGRVLRSYYQVERRHIGLDADGILNSDYNPDTISNESNTTSKDSTDSFVKQEAETTTKNKRTTQRGVAPKKANDEEDKHHSNGMFDPSFLQYLDDIADYCGVSIFVTDFIDKIPYGIGYHTELNSESATKPYHILIYGDQDSSRFAEFKVNIVLERIRGNFIDSIPIELSLQPLVAGPNLTNFKYIERVSKTKIFVPEWLPELFASQTPNPNARNLNEVYIAGEEFHVLVAKLMLKDIIKRNQPLVKDCVISFAKIDLLSLRFQDSLRKIMVTHGTFIQIPYLGAARAVIRVQSPSLPICNLTITELMNLTTLLYNATYWVHTGEEDGQGSFLQPNIPVDFDILDRVSAGSGATIVCKNTSFDIIGLKSDTKRAVAMIKSLPIWEQSKQQVRYRVELSNEQREFISGKKNGKILRIMNTANVFIKLLPFNEYNFYVDIYSELPPEATNGLKLLEEELPSELAFYIPETYHKKVIGAGGSTVQSIMRKYNVFIKFSSGYDVNPNGYTRLKSTNVLIRCPSKNAKEMEPAKNELLETVFDRSQEHGTTFIKLSRSYMRILLAHHVDFLSGIESSTNTIVNLPSEEHYEDVEQKLEIRGLMGTSDNAARLIKTKLPEDYEFKVAFSSKFHELVNEDAGEFYQKVIVPFRFALKIETLVNEKPEHTSEETPYHQILLSFAQENSVGLEDAIQVLTAYLRDKGLDIIERGEYHVDPIIPGVVGVVPIPNKRRRPNTSHGPHGRMNHGYDNRGMDGIRDRFRGPPGRGSPNRAGARFRTFDRHRDQDRTQMGDNGRRHSSHHRESQPGMYRHDEIRNASHPYRKGPLPTPPTQRRNGYQNRYNNADRNTISSAPSSSTAGSQPGIDEMNDAGYYESPRNGSYSSGGYRSPPQYPSQHGNHHMQQQPNSYQQPIHHQQSLPPMPPPSQSGYDRYQHNPRYSHYQSQQQPLPHQMQGPPRNDMNDRHAHSSGNPAPYYVSGGNMLNDRNSSNSGYNELPPPPPPDSRGQQQRGRYMHHQGGQIQDDRYGRNQSQMDPLPPPPPPPGGSGNSYEYDGRRGRYNNY